MMTMKIDAMSLKKEWDDGGVVLIDVRTPAEFGASHIPGSELMPLDDLRPEEIGQRECVIVCGTGKRATLAMEKLSAAGCRNLQILEGGVTSWERAGFPVNRGKGAISLER